MGGAGGTTELKAHLGQGEVLLELGPDLLVHMAEVLDIRGVSAVIAVLIHDTAYPGLGELVLPNDSQLECVEIEGRLDVFFAKNVASVARDLLVGSG